MNKHTIQFDIINGCRIGLKVCHLRFVFNEYSYNIVPSTQKGRGKRDVVYNIDYV